MTAPRNRPIGRFYDLQQEAKVPDDYVLTSKVKIKAPTRKQMVAFRNSTTSEEADRAFLGDSADAVFELFADHPEQYWMAFVGDMQKHFAGPGAADVEGKSEQSSE